MKSNIRQLVNYPAKMDKPYAQWGVNGRPIGYPGHIPNLSLIRHLELDFKKYESRDFCVGLADKGETPTELFVFKNECSAPVLKLSLRDVVRDESDACFVTVTPPYKNNPYDFVAYLDEADWEFLTEALGAEPYMPPDFVWHPYATWKIP